MFGRLPKRISLPFVCPRCQIRSQRRQLTTSVRRLAQVDIAGSRPQGLQYARLNGRSIIKLEGPDVLDFLQGLLPAKLDSTPASAGGHPIYTAFLTAQGRLSHDVFVYTPTGSPDIPDAWFIEVDAGAAPELIKHLRKHKLRSKFKMDKISPEEMSVYSTWAPQEGDVKLRALELDGQIGGLDPRPTMGSRWIMKPDEALSALTSNVGTLYEVEATDYTVHRMLNGIAEGQEEIVALSALPQETNIDFFGGIDFHKGCYLGQELTIRTHHTGVVRKRILPCQIYDESSPIDPSQESPSYVPKTELRMPIPGSNISKLVASSKRSTGKWLGGMGNIGLALCRLEMMTDLSVTDEPLEFDPSVAFKVIPPKDSNDQAEVLIKPFVPPWLRAKIKESKARRTKRKPKEGGDQFEGG